MEDEKWDEVLNLKEKFKEFECVKDAMQRHRQ